MIADALMDNPADRRTVAEWAQAVALGERTLMRIVLAETGMTFSRWRQQFSEREAGQTGPEEICRETNCKLRRMPEVRDAFNGLSRRRWLELERFVSDDLDAEA